VTTRHRYFPIPAMCVMPRNGLTEQGTSSCASSRALPVAFGWFSASKGCQHFQGMVMAVQ
jgi:hypothetical protein